MGFTFFEKEELKQTLRDPDVIQSLLEEYPIEVINFLKQEKLLGQIRDYSIIPSKQRLHKPENLTITYVLDSKTFVYDILAHWNEFLSPPVIIFSLVAFIVYGFRNFDIIELNLI